MIGMARRQVADGAQVAVRSLAIGNLTPLTVAGIVAGPLSPHSADEQDPSVVPFRPCRAHTLGTSVRFSAQS